MTSDGVRRCANITFNPIMCTIFPQHNLTRNTKRIFLIGQADFNFHMEESTTKIRTEILKYKGNEG